jgi:hypothetical protein
MCDTTAGAAESLARPGGKIVAVDQTLREPHSTRKFLPKPVVLALVDEALALARCAPSNSAAQRWWRVFVGGPARNRLKAPFRVADHEAPRIPTPQKAFEHYRYGLGAEVYGPTNKLCIAHEPVEKRMVFLDN